MQQKITKNTSSTNSQAVLKDPTINRIKGGKIVILFLFILLACLFLFYQVIDSHELSKAADDERSKNVSLPALRGNILDANDIILANSTSEYKVNVDQSLASTFDPDEFCVGDKKDICNVNGMKVIDKGAAGMAKILAPLLNLNAQELGYKLSGDKTVLIAKNVKSDVAQKIRDMGFSSLTLDETSSRSYPNSKIAGPEVGAARYVDSDEKDSFNPDKGRTVGTAGIELLMDKELAGTKGYHKFQMTDDGKRIPGAKDEIKNPVNGKNIKTTLDLDVQWKLQQLIDENVKKQNATLGFGVVEKVSDGSVVAITENNAAAAGSDDVAVHGSPVFTTAFDPGSTMKTVSFAELIDKGITTPETYYTVGWKYTIPGTKEVIKDAENHATRRVTSTGILGQSWNTGTVMASQPLSFADRVQMFKNFGFGQKTAVNFPGETPGVVPSVEDMDNDLRTANTVMFGQGMTVSALQMVNAYSTIANKGKDPVPSIISAEQDSQTGKWVPFKKSAEGKQVLPADVATQSLGMLEGSVVDGMCHSAAIDGYRVGGKTGTAELWNDEKKNLSDTMISFISVFPIDNPQYVVGVFFKNPTGEYSTVVAIPPAKEMMQFLIQKYSIPTSVPGTHPKSW
ncbi:MAG: penicillin-binding protein 2 [Candidatus Ancillula sp.]|jgi:cell division protein FtsI (penicillin-binding protein 3)|nr:penicillin-binding protein 2 [Candidatus Ancillula sp.]